MHLHIIWFGLKKGDLNPQNDLEHTPEDIAVTLRAVTLSWFSTLVDRGDGLNIFEVWLVLFPKHAKRINAVRQEMSPSLNVLREFRDKVGFHGDKPRDYFRARLTAIRERDSLVNGIQEFLELANFLLRKESNELPEFIGHAETLILNMELEFDTYIERDWFKRAWILPRGNFKKVFK